MLKKMPPTCQHLNAINSEKNREALKAHWIQRPSWMASVENILLKLGSVAATGIQADSGVSVYPACGQGTLGCLFQGRGCWKTLFV